MPVFLQHRLDLNKHLKPEPEVHTQFTFTESQKSTVHKHRLCQLIILSPSFPWRKTASMMDSERTLSFCHCCRSRQMTMNMSHLICSSLLVLLLGLVNLPCGFTHIASVLEDGKSIKHYDSISKWHLLIKGKSAYESFSLFLSLWVVISSKQ